MTQRAEGSLDWPLASEQSSNLGDWVSKLAHAMDASAPEIGAAIVLVEAPAAGKEDLPRLAESLAAHWENQGLTCLVVDAHPADAFTNSLFEGTPEGFTEILHYGLSPATAARSREGAPGMWIPAGAPWTLPLESPDEPLRSLNRLIDQADRVLILADVGDAEGLLAKLREAAHFRLVLKGRETAAAAMLEESEDIGIDSEPEIFALGGEYGRRRRGRSWILVSVLLVVVMAAAAWWMQDRGVLDRVRGPSRADSGHSASDNGFSALPEKVALPYHGGSEQAADSARRLAEARELQEAEKAKGAIVLEAKPEELESEAPTLVLPPTQPQTPSGRLPDATVPRMQPRGIGETPARVAAQPPRTGPAEPQRRHEARSNWRSALDHSGTFHVHVESYRDSVLGARTARERGFGNPGFSLRPVRVQDDVWYRLCVGPFPDLKLAASYRDSLLDTGGEDYCVVGTDPPH